MVMKAIEYRDCLEVAYKKEGGRVRKSCNIVVSLCEVKCLPIGPQGLP